MTRNGLSQHKMPGRHRRASSTGNRRQRKQKAKKNRKRHRKQGKLIADRSPLYLFCKCLKWGKPRITFTLTQLFSLSCVLLFLDTLLTNYDENNANISLAILLQHTWVIWRIGKCTVGPYTCFCRYKGTSHGRESTVVIWTDHDTTYVEIALNAPIFFYRKYTAITMTQISFADKSFMYRSQN